MIKKNFTMDTEYKINEHLIVQISILYQHFKSIIDFDPCNIIHTIFKLAAFTAPKL
jgi:hypothetical protein